MPELRKDPVSDRWVIISTDRARRPSDFVRKPVPAEPSGRFCPFCAGSEAHTPREIMAYRKNGAANTPGWDLRVVPNKFPALAIEGDLEREGEGLFDRMRGVGAHEVVIESPDHVLGMAELPEVAIERTLNAFRDRVRDLRNDHRLRYILLFKNHGESAGMTVEHTHSQLIALPVVPKRVQEELDVCKKYFDFKDRCVFCDIVRQETKAGTRIVAETDEFVAIAPYAARFPFETWIMPRRHGSHYEESSGPQLGNLAWILRSVLRKLDKVLERPAWNLLIHTMPMQEGPCPYYHWHIEIIPSLTRVAGFEMGTGFYINPTPPEESAQFLREAGLS